VELFHVVVCRLLERHGGDLMLAMNLEQAEPLEFVRQGEVRIEIGLLECLMITSSSSFCHSSL
jgi:hypothetical protein